MHPCHDHSDNTQHACTCTTHCAATPPNTYSALVTLPSTFTRSLSGLGVADLELLNHSAHSSGAMYSACDQCYSTLTGLIQDTVLTHNNHAWRRFLHLYKMP